jgi:hypothetical protein
MIVGMADPKVRRSAGRMREEGCAFTLANAVDTALMADVMMGGIASSLVLEGVTALTSLCGLVLMECCLIGMGLLKPAEGPSRKSIAMTLNFILQSV